MKFNIDTTIKRVYQIEYIRFDCASVFEAVFTVKCREKQAYFEVEYAKLFKELEENTYSSIEDIETLNILEMINYLIERQNKYIIDKIILALNDNECQVLKSDAYDD